ncbi:MAG: periplasmic heavy metal sensor [Candidatus Eremiobacteraeota bacterium]|nr:periplasmic heavy metal sensor [Candidatus Eremiobacteraeota bacterium]
MALVSTRLFKFALLLTLALCAPAISQNPGDMGLTREQAAALQKIRSGYAAKRQDVLEQLRVKKLDLMQLLKANDPEAPKIKAKLREIMDVELKLQHLYVDEMFDCRSQMNDEQWTHYRRNVIRLMMNE